MGDVAWFFKVKESLATFSASLLLSIRSRIATAESHCWVIRLLPYMRRAYTISRMDTWDERKRRTNLKDHGIDFADLEGFFDGDLLTREDTREAYGEERYQSVGVFNGVSLFVVWTPRDDEGEMTHLISARKAENHEYKAWLARYSKR